MRAIAHLCSYNELLGSPSQPELGRLEAGETLIQIHLLRLPQVKRSGISYDHLFEQDSAHWIAFCRMLCDLKSNIEVDSV